MQLSYVVFALIIKEITMATIKSYTDIEQSRKLVEILPIESADMVYIKHATSDNLEFRFDDDMPPMVLKNVPISEITADTLPCWSLAALLGVLPSRLFDSTPKRKELYLLPDLDKSYCFYRQFAVKTKGKIYLLTEGKCLVDACVTMIEKLHELNLL